MSAVHEPKRFEGLYLGGPLATPQRVFLRLTPEVVFIDRPEGSFSWAWWEVRETAGGGGAIRLDRVGAAGQALLVEAPGFRAALDQQQGVSRVLATDEARRTWTRKRVWVTGLAALGALFVFGIVPTLATVVATHLPVPLEQQLGDSALESLAPDAKRCRDPELTRTLDRLSKRLVSAIPSMPYDLQIVVADTPGINAFALPGGRIVVLRGLLRKARSPEELAGVIAHEVQHVLHRDVTTALVRRLSFHVLVAAVLGNWHLAGAAEALTNLHYDRGQEAAADRDGMALMRGAGLDGREMISAYQMLQDNAPDLPSALALLSDHPDMGVRLKDLKARVGRPAPTTPPFLLDEPWTKTVERCATDDAP